MIKRLICWLKYHDWQYIAVNASVWYRGKVVHNFETTGLECKRCKKMVIN